LPVVVSPVIRCFTTRVEVVSGFYRGNKGTIKSHYSPGTDWNDGGNGHRYGIEIDGREKYDIEIIEERHLREIK